MNYKHMVIEVGLSEANITRLVILGLNADQIRKVARHGLSPDNAIHWHALVYATEHGEIDRMLEDPTTFIKEGKKRWLKALAT